MNRRERPRTNAAVWMACHPGIAITTLVVLVAVEVVLLVTS